jgi:hypothetical protein
MDREYNKSVNLLVNGVNGQFRSSLSSKSMTHPFVGSAFVSDASSSFTSDCEKQVMHAAP